MPLPASTRLLDQSIREMQSREQEFERRERQAHFLNRYHILTERWAHLVHSVILGVHRSETIRESLYRHINTDWNVLKTLCDRVCVAYETPPLRTLEGSSEAVAQDWKQLLKQSSINTMAKQILREAFAMNVVLVVPIIRPDPKLGRKLCFRRLLPHATEVFTDRDDPSGPPVAVAWTEEDVSDHTRGRHPQITGYLDHKSLRFFDEKGQEIKERRFDHDLGVLPVTEFRLGTRPVDDWWDRHRGSHAVRATVGVGYIHTKMDWVRSGQDRYREILASEKIANIPIQVSGADGPIEIPLSKVDVDWIAIDVNTPIDNHRDHARYRTGLVAESYGVNSAELDLDPTGQDTANSSPQALGRRHSALARIRKDQIEHLREAEEDLWWKAALMMRRAGHPLANSITPERVAETFSVSWGPLSFVDHPKVRLEIWEKEIDMGLKSTFMVAQESLGLSPEEARKRTIQVAEEEAELEKIYVSRNVPRHKSDRLQDLSQIMGRLGGNVGGGRPTTSDEGENDDDRE